MPKEVIFRCLLTSDGLYSGPMICTVDAQADYRVTGGEDLPVLKKYKGGSSSLIREILKPCLPIDIGGSKYFYFQNRRNNEYRPQHIYRKLKEYGLD